MNPALVVVCSGGGCEKFFVPSRWGNQAAQNKGWFLQRNGQVWCPDHVPDWVPAWRLKKELKPIEDLFRLVIKEHQRAPHVLEGYATGFEERKE